MNTAETIALIILGIDIAREGIAVAGVIDRLIDGISARAQNEGREVTPEESAIIRGLREESAKRRSGEL